jgi:hypothetical protein
MIDDWFDILFWAILVVLIVSIVQNRRKSQEGLTSDFLHRTRLAMKADYDREYESPGRRRCTSCTMRML